MVGKAESLQSNGDKHSEADYGWAEWALTSTTATPSPPRRRRTPSRRCNRLGAGIFDLLPHDQIHFCLVLIQVLAGTVVSALKYSVIRVVLLWNMGMPRVMSFPQRPSDWIPPSVSNSSIVRMWRIHLHRHRDLLAHALVAGRAAVAHENPAPQVPLIHHRPSPFNNFWNIRFDNASFLAIYQGVTSSIDLELCAEQQSPWIMYSPCSRW